MSLCSELICPYSAFISVMFGAVKSKSCSYIQQTKFTALNVAVIPIFFISVLLIPDILPTLPCSSSDRKTLLLDFLSAGLKDSCPGQGINRTIVAKRMACLSRKLALLWGL